MKFSEPISDHVSDENTISKTVEFKNGEIVVTVKYNTSENTNSFKEQGIYEKYLRLKQKNVIVPCFHCGRGTSDLDRFEDGDSVSDNDTIIDSHEHNENDVSVKKSSKTKNKNDFFTLRKRKKVDESDVPKRTSTPKESEGRKEVEEQVNPAPDILPIVLKEEVSPKCSKPCGYHLRTGSKVSRHIQKNISKKVNSK